MAKHETVSLPGGLRPELKARPPRAARTPWLALASGLLSALIPKCPMCFAAYLSAFGVSVGTASIALGLLRPLGFALAAIGLALGVLRWKRRQAAWRKRGTALGG